MRSLERKPSYFLACRKVTIEPATTKFPNLSSRTYAARAAENMFSLLKLCSDKEQAILAFSHGKEYRPANQGEESCTRKVKHGIEHCKFWLNAIKQADGSWNLNLRNLTHNH